MMPNVAVLYVIGPLGLTALFVGGKRRWFTDGLLIVIGYVVICYLVGLVVIL